MWEEGLRVFKSLKDILPGTIEELGISEQLKRAAAFAAWRAVAAELPLHARAARPVRFLRGVLVVEAPSSAAIHELHMRTPQLMRDLNKRMGRPLVSKLEFRVRGQRPAPRATPGSLPQPNRKTPRPPAAADDVTDRQRRLRQAIELIADPAVRQQAVARLEATEEGGLHRCEQCGTQLSEPGACPLCQAESTQHSGE